jgi:hypothetical protein
MVPTEEQLAQWKQAYRLLDVPDSACRQTIKTSYRNLVKRWHPDRYSSGSASQTEAGRMTEMLTAAYSVIQHAPLSALAVRKPTPPVASPRQSIGTPRNLDWLRIGVRFAFGALVGSVFSVRFAFYQYVTASTIISGMLVTILLCGFIAAICGDRIWQSMWRWWWR